MQALSLTFVSDDADLGSEIARATNIRGQCLSHVSMSQLLSGTWGVAASSRKTNGGRYSSEDLRAESDRNGQATRGKAILLIDLRAETTWRQVPELLERGQGVWGKNPYVVGLVDGTLRVDCCLLAQQYLDEIISGPSAGKRLEQLIDRVDCSTRRTLRSTSREIRELVGGGERFVTRTPALFPLFDQVELVAQRELTTLLVGETGTGKTTLAKIIHGLSPRRHGSFVNVACGTLQSELIGCTLFGHERGAFTGADAAKEGKFAAAQDGTILLDEIDILGVRQQAQLLRVLETGQYESLGSNDTRITNARVIVATCKPLPALIEQGRFLPELYFRLNQVTLEIPPLRTRPHDIVPLALPFIEQSSQHQRIEITAIHPEVLDAWESYSWPGNVRELRNEVNRAVLFARHGVIDVQALSSTFTSVRQIHGDKHPSRGLAGEVASTEQSAIERMLKLHRYNRTATAHALGISRVTLYNKIRRYRIDVGSLRAEDNDAG